MHVRCSTYFEDVNYEVLCSNMFIIFFRDIVKVLLTRAVLSRLFSSSSRVRVLAIELERSRVILDLAPY